jgi:hypothetical protein
LSVHRERLPRRMPGVEVVDSDTRSVLMEPRHRTTHVLNPTARAVWEMCDGTTTIDELADAICQVFSVSRQEAIAGVAQVIRQLEGAGLVGWTDRPREAG